MGKASGESPHESVMPILRWCKAQKPAMSEADFLRQKLDGMSHGVWTNWKRRGIAKKEYSRVAHAIGMTTDQYRQAIGEKTPYADLTPDAIQVARDWMAMGSALRAEWAASIHEAAERARKMGQPATDERVEGAYYPERRKQP